MEYDDLMKQAKEYDKELHRSKDINVADCLTFEDRDDIAKIIDARIAEEYGTNYPFKWSFNCSGHFIC